MCTACESQSSIDFSQWWRLEEGRELQSRNASRFWCSTSNIRAMASAGCWGGAFGEDPQQIASKVERAEHYTDDCPEEGRSSFSLLSWSHELFANAQTGLQPLVPPWCAGRMEWAALRPFPAMGFCKPPGEESDLTVGWRLESGLEERLLWKWAKNTNLINLREYKLEGRFSVFPIWKTSKFINIVTILCEYSRSR